MIPSKVKEAQDLWMTIPLDDNYYAWVKSMPYKDVAWKNMTDEQAVVVIQHFKEYKAGRENVANNSLPVHS